MFTNKEKSIIENLSQRFSYLSSKESKGYTGKDFVAFLNGILSQEGFAHYVAQGQDHDITKTTKYYDLFKGYVDSVFSSQKIPKEAKSMWDSFSNRDGIDRLLNYGVKGFEKSERENLQKMIFTFGKTETSNIKIKVPDSLEIYILGLFEQAELEPIDYLDRAFKDLLPYFKREKYGKGESYYIYIKSNDYEGRELLYQYLTHLSNSIDSEIDERRDRYGIDSDTLKLMRQSESDADKLLIKLKEKMPLTIQQKNETYRWFISKYESKKETSKDYKTKKILLEFKFDHTNPNTYIIFEYLELILESIERNKREDSGGYHTDDDIKYIKEIIQRYKKSSVLYFVAYDKKEIRDIRYLFDLIKTLANDDVRWWESDIKRIELDLSIDVSFGEISEEDKNKKIEASKELIRRRKMLIEEMNQKLEMIEGKSSQKFDLIFDLILKNAQDLFYNNVMKEVNYILAGYTLESYILEFLFDELNKKYKIDEYESNMDSKDREVYESFLSLSRTSALDKIRDFIEKNKRFSFLAYSSVDEDEDDLYITIEDAIKGIDKLVSLSSIVKEMRKVFLSSFPKGAMYVLIHGTGDIMLRDSDRDKTMWGSYLQSKSPKHERKNKIYLVKETLELWISTNTEPLSYTEDFRIPYTSQIATLSDIRASYYGFTQKFRIVIQLRKDKYQKERDELKYKISSENKKCGWRNYSNYITMSQTIERKWKPYIKKLLSCDEIQR